MKNLSKIVTLAVAGFAGAAGGMLSAQTFTPAAEPVVERVSAVHELANDASGADLVELTRKLWAQERRIDELERAPSTEAEGSEARDIPDALPPDLDDPAAMAEHVLRAAEEFEARVDDHYADERDEDWAAPSERALDDDFERLAEDGSFELVGVDCRTDSCAATLRFGDREQAVDGYAELLHQAYGVNCIRTVVVPPADEVVPEAPVEVTMLFECLDA